MSSPSPDLYATLGVERSATASEIKRAYKKLALKYHPDKNPPEKRDACEARFKAVAKAYEVLSNDALRARYDRDGLTAADGGADSAPSGGYQQQQSAAYARPSGFHANAKNHSCDESRRAGGGFSHGDGGPRGPSSPFHPASPLFAHFMFADPFELFERVFADGASPLSPPQYDASARSSAFGSPLSPNHRNDAGFGQNGTTQRPRALASHVGFAGRGTDGPLGRLSAMMDRMTLMTGWAGDDAMMPGMGTAFAGPDAMPDDGFFSSTTFEGFTGGNTAGGMRSFSSRTVISNGQARTQTVKRFTDAAGQVHEERHDAEGQIDPRRLGGFGRVPAVGGGRPHHPANIDGASSNASAWNPRPDPVHQQPRAAPSRHPRALPFVDDAAPGGMSPGPTRRHAAPVDQHPYDRY